MDNREIDFIPLVRMKERIALAKADSNSEFFHALMYGCEFICKMVVSLLVPAISNDQDRSRYRFEYQLVRADGIGEWSEILQKVLTGPSSVLLDSAARSVQKELSEKVQIGDWRYHACSTLSQALLQVVKDCEPLPVKASLLRWFSDFSQLRNKTRGHGAVSGTVMDKTIPFLSESFSQMASELTIFKLPIAYIRRNLSGKYRVSLIGGTETVFSPLKSTVDLSYEDGVYVHYNQMRQCSLIQSDVDLSDFYLPNGGFNDKSFELLSYLSGNTTSNPSIKYLHPVDKLPGSITEGQSTLEVIGNVFCNLPHPPPDYVERRELEEALFTQLKNVEVHPIVTMDGRGGIGKTSTALHVIIKLIHQADCPYQMVIWFSARDIDLMTDGVKEVRPAGLTKEDFSKAFLKWSFPLFTYDRDNADPGKVLAEALSKGDNEGGAILFVFDNFETVVSPEETYQWIDTFVRPPNKVLITTRVRGKFRADYPINVKGMDENESRNLIEMSSARLGISERMSSNLKSQIIEESGGHPYVIKIMVGEIAKHPNVKKVERVIAARDDVLDALFERSYRKLSPAAQRIFLTLSSWRSLCSELSVEAIMIRPESEIFDPALPRHLTP